MREGSPLRTGEARRRGQAKWQCLRRAPASSLKCRSVHRSRTLFFVVSCLLALAATGCGKHVQKAAPPPPVPNGTTITIGDASFSPPMLTVYAATIVTVHNTATTTQSVDANTDAFNTGPIPPGGTATFPAPAVAAQYTYFSATDKAMKGTLVVLVAPPPPP